MGVNRNRMIVSDIIESYHDFKNIYTCSTTIKKQENLEYGKNRNKIINKWRRVVRKYYLLEKRNKNM